jgi:(1->4)-alpha-D-glucan 1-alpha-D-glucosylmutase
VSSAVPDSRASAHAPRATYRLQFNEHFRLADALALVPYFSELGVSHLYASPLLKARPHSLHGYDICDYNQINPEIGTEEELERLVAALRQNQMGLVLDTVPNHMAVAGSDNRWWWDVLKSGTASPFAGHFDIDWESSDPRLNGKVLVPLLGERYQDALAGHKLQVRFEAGKFTLQYAEHRFPLAANTLTPLLARAAELYRSEALFDLAEKVAQKTPALIEQEIEHYSREVPAVAEALAQSAREFDRNPDALDRLLQQQHYRLSFWANGDAELNYRRFFNIASLAGLRTEQPGVFSDVHQRVLSWSDRGWIDGFRIDHIDGLRDPQGYLERLHAAAPQLWKVVEKVLEPGEHLPSTWPIAGTTGYDFLYRTTGVFVDEMGEKALTDLYSDFVGDSTDYAALVLVKNRLILRNLLGAEIERLVALLLQIAARRWRVRDFSPVELRAGVMELIACLPVYRTYAQPHIGVVSEVDQSILSEGIATARQQRPDLEAGLFDFLGDVLSLRLRGDLESEFVMRVQQVTGSAMGKGVEDTAFYCYNRFIALNEVGCDPGRFGISPGDFHVACRETQAQWPNTMLASSTHDTKFSEDTRARLCLLSEIPEQWGAAVRRWRDWNERYREDNLPGRNFEYRFYQTLVGAWPLELDRALSHFEKVACEAKTRTSWTNHNVTYEKAMRAFVVGTSNDAQFTADLERFVQPLIEAGYVNSLAQTLLKLTAPGVPDFYQGCELWNFRLVDPDNRHPVEFTLRQRLLVELHSLPLEEIWRRRNEGLPKLWLIRQTLSLRRQRPDLFDASAGYEPLFAQGAKANHAIAFIRGGKAITVVPRLVLGLNGEWSDTRLELPRGKWRNELTQNSAVEGTVPLADLLRRFPVALLIKEDRW